MKKMALIFAMLLTSIPTLASDFDVKGFMVFNLLNLENRSYNDGPSISTEIVTLDLKFYFRHEDFSAKIKLDLDGGIQDSEQEIYEEALISWRLNRSQKISGGKGKIRFHQMHFGAARPSYIDGGSILGSSNSWRDQDNKLMLELKSGSYRSGFINEFAFYGNANAASIRNGSPELDGSKSWDEIKYEGTKELNSKEQRGFANKFTYTPAYGVKYSIAGNYYWRDIDPKADWAVDIAMNDTNNEREYWFEYMYGFTSKHPNDRYTAKRQWEHYIQTGYEYRFTETFSMAASAEAVLVKKEAHWAGDYPSGDDARDGNYGQGRYNNGENSRFNSYMGQVAGKWRLAKRVSFKLGLTYERKYTWNSPEFPNDPTSATDAQKTPQYMGFDWAWQLSSGLSYWF